MAAASASVLVLVLDRGGQAMFPACSLGRIAAHAKHRTGRCHLRNQRRRLPRGVELVGRNDISKILKFHSGVAIGQSTARKRANELSASEAAGDWMPGGKLTWNRGVVGIRGVLSGGGGVWRAAQDPR